jgi:cytochrome b involved in lipid metabolism
VGLIVVFSRQRKQHVKQLEQLKPKTKEKRFKIYTTAEVKAHNSLKELWLVVQHRESKEWRVYDVTDFVDDHPGGEAALLRNGGGNATKGFYGPHHPDAVFVMMEDFCIGKLAEGESY